MNLSKKMLILGGLGLIIISSLLYMSSPKENKINKLNKNNQVFINNFNNETSITINSESEDPVGKIVSLLEETPRDFKLIAIKVVDKEKNGYRVVLGSEFLKNNKINKSNFLAKLQSCPSIYHKIEEHCELMVIKK